MIHHSSQNQRASALFCALVFVFVSAAWEQADASPNRRILPGTPLNHTTYVYEYDGQGQRNAEFGTTYNPDGDIVARSEQRWRRDRTGRVTENLWRYMNSEDEPLQRRVTQYIYEKGRLAGLHRAVTNFVRDHYRTEEVRFHVFVEGRGTVQETRVFGRDRELMEVRYLATDRNKAGKTMARDYSVYDPEDVQIRRRLETFVYNRDGKMATLERFHFDEDDEVSLNESGIVYYDGRLERTTAWTLNDGDEVLTGYRDETVELHPGHNRVLRRTTVYFDAAGSALQRRIETTSYDGRGRTTSKRVEVEKF
jgi:hypothetical protein